MFYKDDENGVIYSNKKIEEHKHQRNIERQFSKPEEAEQIMENQYAKLRRQLSNDTISLNMHTKTDEGNHFYLNNNNKECTDDLNSKILGFADLTNFRNPSEQAGNASSFNDIIPYVIIIVIIINSFILNEIIIMCVFRHSIDLYATWERGKRFSCRTQDKSVSNGGREKDHQFWCSCTYNNMATTVAAK